MKLNLTLSIDGIDYTTGLMTIDTAAELNAVYGSPANGLDKVADLLKLWIAKTLKEQV